MDMKTTNWEEEYWRLCDAFERVLDDIRTYIGKYKAGFLDRPAGSIADERMNELCRIIDKQSAKINRLERENAELHERFAALPLSYYFDIVDRIIRKPAVPKPDMR